MYNFTRSFYFCLLPRSKSSAKDSFLPKIAKNILLYESTLSYYNF